MTLLLTNYFIVRRPSTVITLSMLVILLLAGPVRAESLDEAVAALDSGRYQAARQSFENLARHGDADAQVLLGIMYSEGKGGQADIQQGRHWLETAAHQGSHDAQFLLGLSYLGSYGNSGQSDLSRARIWLRRSAHNGNALAQRFLVRAYRHGWFGSRNQQHASYWQERLQAVN